MRLVDVMVHRKPGITYNALPGVGVNVEIVRHLHEARDLDSTGLMWTVLAVALFAFLLLHQLDELAEHVDQRFRQSKHLH